MRRLPIAALSLATCLLAAPAWAGCITVPKANYTIREAGSYCLAANMVATKNGVIIAADNVDLDCGGYTIDGSAQAASNTNRGVVGYSRTGVTVRNCTTKGFIEGIRLTGDGNNIHDNVVIAPLSRGLVVEGEENIIDGNRISDAGGSTNVSWGAFGIRAVGSSIIRDNVVSGVLPTAGSNNSGYGIYTTGNDAGVLQGNTVRNVLSDGGRIAMALTAHDSANAVLRENILVNPPGSYGYALYCSGAGSVTNGNLFQGFDIGISSACTSVDAE
ncbi:MAG: NosD domain-containing protein [Luteimonas sp.]